MLNKFLIGALALGLLGGIAYADDQAAAPAQAQAQADQGPDGEQQGMWHRHMGGHRHDMRGEMRGPGGPGGPDMIMGKQGFRLQLGPNVSVGLMCGTQALKDCIAEAQPLIDAAKSASTQTK
ncbi:MAG: hypothetical protein M3O03_13695 [Pseudomonadota bacterium]|nr:hypothetical protein [Pseudomonadota bacterium]